MKILSGTASILAVGGLLYLKYKLALSGPIWWALVLGGLVFAISTPAETSTQ